jgi:hypothetical protein
MICADGGGSNGSRVRLWKTELARLADEQSVEITLCHLPARDVEVEQDRAPPLPPHLHELPWSPLTSHDVIVELIRLHRDRHGPPGPCRAGRWLLCHRDQDFRQAVLGAEAAANSTAQFPWRLELHPGSREPITHTLPSSGGEARVGALCFNGIHHYEWRRSVSDDDRWDCPCGNPRETGHVASTPPY